MQLRDKLSRDRAVDQRSLLSLPRSLFDIEIIDIVPAPLSEAELPVDALAPCGVHEVLLPGHADRIERYLVMGVSVELHAGNRQEGGVLPLPEFDRRTDVKKPAKPVAFAAEALLDTAPHARPRQEAASIRDSRCVNRVYQQPASDENWPSVS